MRSLGWSAIALAVAAAVGIAVFWMAFFGFSFGGVSSIDSRSMSHADENMDGVLDPGEWRKITPVGDRSEVRTFYEGREQGYRVGQDFGDVIAYSLAGTDPGRDPGIGPSMPGSGDGSELIEHRAIAWIVYNETADAYDVPELDIHGTRTLVLDGIGTYDRGQEAYVHRDLEVVLDPDLAGRHDGFLTKGDHNQGADQDARGGLEGVGHVELVTLDRIRGKVTGHVDTTWIRAAQIGVPLASLAVAGGVYAWRRGTAAGWLPERAQGSQRCPACGQAYEGDEGFCLACGTERERDGS